MINYETGFSEHVYRYRKMTELGLMTLNGYLFFQRSLRQSLEPVPQDVLTVYENYRPIIAEIYGKSHYNDKYLYHGTGRYHYQPSGDDKYRSETDGKVIDVLATILSSGLQPHRDVWVPTPASEPTVSLTRQRFYARWYADKYNKQGLLWSYGNTKDWASMFVVKNISNLLEIPYIALLLRSQVKKGSTGGLLGSVHNWVSDARNDITSRTNYVDALLAKSTIPGNFGTIFVLKETDVPTYDFPLLRKTEQRSLDPVLPKSIVAIEVPLRYSSVVNALLAKAGQSHIRVLPTECVDYHMSKFPLDELTRVDGLKPFDKPDLKKLNLPKIDFSPVTIGDLRTVISTDQYSPQKLLELLGKSPLLHSLLHQKSSWEGFSIYYHTLSGLHLFDKFFNHPNALPMNAKRDFFRTFYSLHDIGDSLGKSTVEKLAFNKAICTEFLSQLGFSHQEVLMAKALLSDDPIGLYLKKVGFAAGILSHTHQFVQSISLGVFNRSTEEIASETVGRIKKMAELAQMSYLDFLQLLIVFHMVDAGAYTSVGGTVGSLNYVFRFDDMKRMSYSPTIQPLVKLLYSK